MHYESAEELEKHKKHLLHLAQATDKIANTALQSITLASKNMTSVMEKSHIQGQLAALEWAWQQSKMNDGVVDFDKNIRLLRDKMKQLDPNQQDDAG